MRWDTSFAMHLTSLGPGDARVSGCALLFEMPPAFAKPLPTLARFYRELHVEPRREGWAVPWTQPRSLRGARWVSTRCPAAGYAPLRRTRETLS